MRSEYSSLQSGYRHNLLKPLLISLAVVGIVVVLYANAPLENNENGIARAAKLASASTSKLDKPSIKTAEDRNLCPAGQSVTTQGCRSPSELTSVATFASSPDFMGELRKVLEETVGTDQEYKDLLDGALKNNRLLEEHTNYFKNAEGSVGRVYKIGVDAYTVRDTPTNLAYRPYSAVGYGLANEILLVNDGGIIVIDAGSNSEEVDRVIAAYQSAGVLPSGDGKIPLHAIIYTHNHLDHTSGGGRWIERAEMPPCPMRNDGEDGTYTARDCVEIICHKKVVDSVINTATRTGTVINARSAYMYGVFSLGGRINNGIGAEETHGINTFHPPSKTFVNDLKFLVNGMKLYLKYTPSETSDEIIVFVPDSLNNVGGDGGADGADYVGEKGVTVYTPPVAPQRLGSGLLASAEAIQGPAFPNLYSLRGTTFRNPLTWYQSVDILRMYNAWVMVPSHGVPLMGSDNIETVLVNFRDAVQHVHDQTLRFMRLGYIPDELVTMVELPKYILDNLGSVTDGLPVHETPALNPRDYLLTFYGSVPQGIRVLYSGYLGWNEGDPTYFKPLPPVARANRYVNLYGGADKMIKEANRVYLLAKTSGDKQDFQWAAELLTYVLRSDATPSEKARARLLKGKSFLQLAQTTATDSAILESDWFSLNPNWRNWFVVGAEELALHLVEPAPLGFPNGASLNAPRIQSGIPPRYWVQQWCWRFNSENDDLNNVMFGWEFVANAEYWGTKKQRFVLHVAGKVVRLISDNFGVAQAWKKIDLGVSIDHGVFVQLATSDITFNQHFDPPYQPRRFVIELEKLLKDGSIQIVKGTMEDIVAFYDPTRFDIVAGLMPPVVDR